MTNDDLKILLNEIAKVNENVSKVDAKIASIQVDLNETNKTIQKQEIHLERHILRTEINEKSMDLVMKRMEPIEGWMKTFGNTFKIFGFFAALVACFSGVIEALRTFQIHIFN